MRRALVLLLLLPACSSGDREVVTATVERATVTEVVEAPATVTARAVATVTAPADATVAAVLVETGSTVTAGQVLLRLASPSATTALRTALAARAAARDAVSQALAATTLQRAQATFDALTVKAPIAGTLTYGGQAPSSGGSDLLADLPAAVQGLAADALGGSDAPTVTTDDLSVGSPVGAGAVLLTVTDLTTVGLSAEVDETDVLLVEKGDRAQVQLDALPDAGFTGEVTSVDLSPLASTRGGVGYRVRLTLTGTPQPRPGMSAVVRLTVREAAGALSVPSSAVVRDGDDDVVFAVVDGTARKRVVEVGAQGEERVEVTSGLTEGEVVVVRDADGLRDGQQVDP